MFLYQEVQAFYVQLGTTVTAIVTINAFSYYIYITCHTCVCVHFYAFPYFHFSVYVHVDTVCIYALMSKYVCVWKMKIC